MESPTFDEGVAAICTQCGCEFTAIYQGHLCIECGSPLQRSDGSIIAAIEAEGQAYALLDDRAGDDGRWCLVLERATYLGGHPRHPNPIHRGVVLVDHEGITIVDAAYTERIYFRIDDITSIEIDGPTEVQKRVTIPRVLALGVIALAVPKKEKLSYLVVDAEGGDAIIEVLTMNAMELRAAVQPLSALIDGGSSAPVVTSTGADRSIRERLMELKRLHGEGLISDEEHAARRTGILEEI